MNHISKIQLSEANRDRFNSRNGYNLIPDTIKDSEGEDIPNPEKLSPGAFFDKCQMDRIKKVCTQQINAETPGAELDFSDIKTV